MGEVKVAPEGNRSALDRLIEWSLHRRQLVLIAALVLFVLGLYGSSRVQVDVLPDLNRPEVIVLAEAPGRAAEEVEALATIPIEIALMGTAGVQRVRSSSKRGVTMIRAEFDWSADPYRCRQLVTERLDSVGGDLPDDVRITLAPISSVMGEIMLIGVTSAGDQGVSQQDLRSFAEWNLRRRLLAIVGVSNVTVLGGEAKSYQALVDSKKLAAANLDFLSVRQALLGIGSNSGGGFFDKDGREFVFRNMGSIYDLSELKQANVGFRAGAPVRLADIASVVSAPMPRRGDAGINGAPGVIVAVQKQPEASTLHLTEQIVVLAEQLQKESDGRIIVNTELFRQAEFIERALENIAEAMRDGTLIVLVVLFVFLWNLRTTAITLVALPLSLISALLALRLFGLEINTMTLGGLTVAIGELVDDAVVDVENCFRRLRENQLRSDPLPALTVVYRASSEIRNSIVLATLIVILVFLPLYFLGGIEGRLFQPLALAYMVSILSSLATALTVTPVLSYYLLSGSSLPQRDSALVRSLKSLQERNLRRNLANPRWPLLAAAFLFLVAAASTPFLGTAFLPAFNEGTLTIEVINPPGVSLHDSVQRARVVEGILNDAPGVIRVARRTGRAEQDEHAEGVHYSEFDVALSDDIRGERRRALLHDLRLRFAAIPGVSIGIGQPISHRIDHLMSGIRSEIAVVIYGNDIESLQYGAYQAVELLQGLPGVADLRAETAAMAPEIKITVDHTAAGRMGMRPPEITETLASALGGVIVGQIREEGRLVPTLLRLDEISRTPEAIPEFTFRHLPDGMPVRVRDVAEVYESAGPYEIQRENNERRIAVQLNSSGRDLASLVDAIKEKLDAELKLPSGTRYELAGRYQSAVEANRRIALLSILSLTIIAVGLYLNFRSFVLTGQILLNLPFAFIGGILALHLSKTPLSVASLVGFIALAGVAARNGILMISHFQHLIREEGAEFSVDTVVRGALERLTPVLMTAGAAGLALAPVLLTGADAPGKELLYPVALVITGGLFTSTLLDLMITPIIYYHAARRWGLHPDEEGR